MSAVMPEEAPRPRDVVALAMAAGTRRLQEPRAEVAVNLDSGSEDSLR